MKLVGVIILCLVVTSSASAEDLAGVVAPRSFHEQVDLTPLANLAVHRDGRVKSFASFSHEMMSFVSGRARYEGQSPTFSYLDLMFRPERYRDVPIIYVKSKVIRAQIGETLRRSMDDQMMSARGASSRPDFTAREAEVRERLEGQLEAFRKTGLISEPMLLDPEVLELLRRLETDLLRAARYVRMIDIALSVKEPESLARNLRLVPTGGGDLTTRWWSFDELETFGDAGSPVGDPASHAVLVNAWQSLKTAWQNEDVDGVNAAVATLAMNVPTINPDVYPATRRLAWEGWYFQMRNLTWIWLVYAIALIPLILYVVFRWPGARWLGLALFFLAWGLHTFAVLLRWYVADRWPNTNMFEAVTTSAWFGVCLAVVLEVLLRRRPLRCLFAIGGGTAAMVALMAAHFMPLQLNPSIGNMMPVLHDVWLYIHTNVVIFSYCLIFMAAITAVMYLVYRSLRGLQGHAGSGEFARVGGAGSLIMPSPEGGSYLERSRTSLGQVLDGTTMILLEMSFIMLWTGLVMGAIWADHSWGRPWGWDPKEVFALNTFIIFALLIHTRKSVRDKGLWTAVLAVIGCGVMLFNWIVINFTISGLHSYA